MTTARIARHRSDSRLDDSLSTITTAHPTGFALRETDRLRVFRANALANLGRLQSRIETDTGWEIVSDLDADARDFEHGESVCPAHVGC